MGDKNCSGPKNAVNRCKRELEEVKDLIRINEQMQDADPNNQLIKQKLQQLYQLSKTKKIALEDAEIALVNCENSK